MTEPDAGTSPVPLRVAVRHLRRDQLELMRAVLRAGDVPFGIVDGELLTGAEHAEEVAKAMRWASVDTDDDPIGEHDSVRAPLVRASRPELADGRRQATRYRRIVAGLLDELIIGGSLALASRAGAAPWTVIVIHLVYHVAPTVLWGWTIGKAAFGTRVVDRRSLRTPGPAAVTVRWLLPYLPSLVALVGWLHGDYLGAIAVAIYAPIIVDLRGVHDRVARTIVVEAQPKRW